jgi:hypothetical protein
LAVTSASEHAAPETTLTMIIKGYQEQHVDQAAEREGATIPSNRG